MKVSCPTPIRASSGGAAPIVALMVFGLVGYLLLRLLVWKVKKPKALKAEH